MPAKKDKQIFQTSLVSAQKITAHLIEKQQTFSVTPINQTTVEIAIIVPETTVYLRDTE